MNSRILVVCLNPVIQRTLVFDAWEANRVNRARQAFVSAGGKGVDVARILDAYAAENPGGMRAIHLTHAGGHDREKFLAFCREDGIAVEAIDSGSELRSCVTLLDRSKRTTTEIVEESESVKPGIDGLVRAAFERLLPSCRALVLTGTRTPGYTDDMYAWMTRRAVERGLIVALDLKGRDLELCLEELPCLVKPNYEEFTETYFPDGDPGSGRVEDKMRELAARSGATVVLSRGADGALFTRDGMVSALPAESLDPVNTTGCGDALCAGLVAGLVAGASIEAALRLGMSLAARNALTLKPGSLS